MSQFLARFLTSPVSGSLLHSHSLDHSPSFSLSLITISHSLSFYFSFAFHLSLSLSPFLFKRYPLLPLHWYQRNFSHLFYLTLFPRVSIIITPYIAYVFYQLSFSTFNNSPVPVTRTLPANSEEVLPTSCNSCLFAYSTCCSDMHFYTPLSALT